MIQPLDFIEAIRNSCKLQVEIFTEGSCYQFYKILKLLYPQAEAWYDSDHVITKIEDKFYDIAGEVIPGRHIPLSEYGQNHVHALEKCFYEG